jgi:hypothetical protein
MKCKLLVIAPLAAFLLCGCTSIKTSTARLDKPPRGVRVYPPAVYLFVDKARGSQYVVAPDYSRAYDVRPLTVFAQQDFGVELTDGVLSRYSGNQATTGPLAFLQKSSELGARAAGVAVSQVNLPGNFGYPDGIYRLNPQTGVFDRIEPPGEVRGAK